MGTSRARRLIRDAIEACSGPERRRARELLEMAEKELDRSEKTKREPEKNRSNSGWFFDTKTSSIRNMTVEQLARATKSIDEMIGEEERGKME